MAVREMGHDEASGRATPEHAVGAVGGSGRPQLAGPAGTAQVLEGYRGALTRYCARLLGSAFEAEDAVQETMLRAWRGIGGFEGRASLRTWLHRVAMNVCWEMRRAPQRRPQAIDMQSETPAGLPAGALVAGHPSREPVTGSAPPSTGGDDPAERVAARDQVRLAFAVALQRLPPRQRAVLILREVLRWRAKEVADLLGTSVPSVYSALQRARASLAAAGGILTPPAPASTGPAEQALVTRYVDALERADVESLVSLLVSERALTS